MIFGLSAKMGMIFLDLSNLNGQKRGPQDIHLLGTVGHEFTEFTAS